MITKAVPEEIHSQQSESFGCIWQLTKEWKATEENHLQKQLGIKGNVASNLILITSIFPLYSLHYNLIRWWNIYLCRAILMWTDSGLKCTFNSCNKKTPDGVVSNVPFHGSNNSNSSFPSLRRLCQRLRGEPNFHTSSLDFLNHSITASLLESLLVPGYDRPSQLISWYLLDRKLPCLPSHSIHLGSYWGTAGGSPQRSRTAWLRWFPW